MYLGERLSVRRARQLGLSYNLAGREDDPDNYKSNAGKLPGWDRHQKCRNNQGPQGWGVEYKGVHGWGTKLSQTIPGGHGRQSVGLRVFLAGKRFGRTTM